MYITAHEAGGRGDAATDVRAALIKRALLQLNASFWAITYVEPDTLQLFSRSSVKFL